MQWEGELDWNGGEENSSRRQVTVVALAVEGVFHPKAITCVCCISFAWALNSP